MLREYSPTITQDDDLEQRELKLHGEIETDLQAYSTHDSNGRG